MYEPLEVTKCKKCGKVIAEPREIRMRIGEKSFTMPETAERKPCIQKRIRL